MKLKEMTTNKNGILLNPIRLATQGKCNYSEYARYLSLLSNDEIITLKADLSAKITKFNKMVIQTCIQKLDTKIINVFSSKWTCSNF